MVALYSPLTTSNNLGFTFDDDPVSFLFEDFSNCYFTNDYDDHHHHHHPKQQYLASSSPWNLDPYNSCWDIVNQLTIPSSCTPSIFTDPPPTLPCMGGGEGPRQLSPPAVSSGYSGRRAGPTEEATAAGDYRRKKQNHNASERMRRMRINDLYASLRALLPDTHHMKKLSIPNTVDRVVKYIPELQNEVQMLIEKKEQLLPALACTTSTTNSVNFSQATATSSNKSCSGTCSCSVQTTQLGNGEISVQISAPKSLITTLVPISEVLRELEEEDGLVVIDVSSSESDAGRVFHHFHLMALEASQKMIKCELLRETLLTRYQKWEELCLWMISQGLS